MPAYSYKERFIPMILDLSKNQTIRKRRSKGFAKPGDTLYHYYGMRTKYCRKLGESICKEVRTIIIKKDGRVVLFGKRLSDKAAAAALKGMVLGLHILDFQKDKLAWDDGFRPEGTMYARGCFELMLRWWKQTHTLPFIGDLIMWEPITFKEASTARIVK